MESNPLAPQSAAADAELETLKILVADRKAWLAKAEGIPPGRMKRIYKRYARRRATEATSLVGTLLSTHSIADISSAINEAI